MKAGCVGCGSQVSHPGLAYCDACVARSHRAPAAPPVRAEFQSQDQYDRAYDRWSEGRPSAPPRPVPGLPMNEVQVSRVGTSAVVRYDHPETGLFYEAKTNSVAYYRLCKLVADFRAKLPKPVEEPARIVPEPAPFLDAQDLQVDTYRSLSQRGVWNTQADTCVRLLHKPSGISICECGDRSPHRNKAEAVRKMQVAFDLRPEMFLPEKPARIVPEAPAVLRRMTTPAPEAFKTAFLSLNGYHTEAELEAEWQVPSLSGLMFRAGQASFESLLRQYHDRFQYTDDKGPQGHGWQSEELRKLVEDSRALLETSKGGA